MPQLIIADDNPRDRSFLLEVLARYAPTIATSGQEALDACANESEPWIVTDIQMPSLNGIELARHIWERQPAARLLFWSQHSDETYVRTLTKIVPAETVYGYVLKSNPADTVARAAQAVFDEDQCWIDPQVRRVQARTLQRHDALTDAEYEVLIDIALGLTDNAIAERRYLSRRGVQNRLQSLYAKLGANEAAASKSSATDVVNIRTRAVAIALQRGLVNSFELAREEQLLAAWLGKR
ncbi:MAG: response regulator transcription factor [Burkholderiales bacterium]|nr:response regulator transcription factor [Burkholderiales bacterium]